LGTNHATFAPLFASREITARRSLPGGGSFGRLHSGRNLHNSVSFRVEEGLVLTPRTENARMRSCWAVLADAPYWAHHHIGRADAPLFAGAFGAWRDDAPPCRPVGVFCIQPCTSTRYGRDQRIGGVRSGLLLPTAISVRPQSDSTSGWKRRRNPPSSDRRLHRLPAEENSNGADHSDA